MDFALFGIQGSGKGTQSKFLAERYNLQVFETGAQLRSLAQENSELGKKVKEIVEAGRLVPTEIVMEIIENFIARAAESRNIIFDGIPRSAEQADQFEKLMKKHNRDFVGIYFNLPRKEAIKRLATRRICLKCKMVYPSMYQNSTCSACGGKLITRTDDNPSSIENRINAFYAETVPIIEKYAKQNLVMEIDAKPPIEKVTENMLEKVEMFLVKSS